MPAPQNNNDYQNEEEEENYDGICELFDIREDEPDLDEKIDDFMIVEKADDLCAFLEELEDAEILAEP